MLFLSAAFAYGQKPVLYIGAGATQAEFASDDDFVTSLDGWGYTVEYIDDDDFLATAPTWADYLGVFINETVGSGNIKPFGPSKDNYPVPCVCLEGWAPNSDRWGWISSATSDYKEAANGTEDELFFVVWDNSHYITEEYDIDDEIEWSTNTGADLTSIKLRAIKEVNVTYTRKLGKSVALNAEADYWGMVAIDSSASFPNRMFWWGLNQWGMNGSEGTEHYMTSELMDVLQRGCEWAYLREGFTSVDKHICEGNLRLSAFPNPACGIVTISFNAENVSDATVTLYNVTGQELNVLFDSQTAQGINSVTFNADEYQAGVYFLKLEINENVEYTKLIIE